MRLSQLAGCVVVGICPLLFLPELPTPLTVQVIIGGAILIAFYRWGPARYLALTMLFFAWGVLSARQVLWPMQVLPGGNRQVEIKLTAVEGETTYQGNILRFNGQRLWPAPRVTLYGNALPGLPCAGQRWKMTVRLRPIHSQLNEGGFDGQRFALAQHRSLTGRFTSAEASDPTCSYRARYLLFHRLYHFRLSRRVLRTHSRMV